MPDALGDHGDDVVALTRTESPWEADTVVALLQANGVHAYAAHRPLEDVFPALFSPDGTAVMVLRSDTARARSILGAEIEDQMAAEEATDEAADVD